MNNEMEKAEAVANKASEIAKNAWAKARQEEYFEDAIRVYDQAMLSALYMMIEQQEGGVSNENHD